MFTVIPAGGDRMWTFYRDGVIPKIKKKKEDKAGVTLPAINNGPTTPSQVTYMRTQRKGPGTKLQPDITNHLRFHAQQTPNGPFSKDRMADILHQGHFLQAKAAMDFLDIRECGSTTESSPKLLRSMEELVGEDEDEEERDAWGKCRFKEDRETDSGTQLSDDLMDERSEMKPPVTNLKVRRTEENPSVVEEKRFMVYICGGYKDSVAERSAIMENVYPALYLHCKQRGYDFRMVDLRCGVGSPAAERHDTAELHVENVQQCQKTQGHNFMLFVGQKHEVLSLPSTISREAFEALLKVATQRTCRNKAPKGFPASDSQSSITTDSSFTQDSISTNDLEFGEATNSRQSPVCGSRQEGLDEDLKLLQMCYKLDENCLPPLYRLLPISSHNPDMLSMDRECRRKAQKDWSATSYRLWGILQRSAAKALGKEEGSLLLRTILDWEVEAGLRSVDSAPPEEHCHCYKRLIPDLYNNLQNEHVTRYTNLLKGQAQLDPVLTGAQQRFMGRLHQKLRHTNIYERSVGWGQKGLNPKQNQSHQFYTERISSHFQRTVINSINKAMKVTKTSGPYDVVRREAVRVQIQEEMHRHVNHRLHLLEAWRSFSSISPSSLLVIVAKMCGFGRLIGMPGVHLPSDVFEGRQIGWNRYTFRKTFLDEMKKAVEQSTSRLILLVAPPGWGKSTTMAAVAQSAPSWLPGSVRTLVHFIGFTGESRNIRLVLQSLCVQLSEASCPHTQLSEDFPQLINEFHSLLGLVGTGSPLVVLLDGLDELSEEHSADLSWIPSPLPPNVYLILSATAGSPCTHTLQSAHPTVLSLPPLSPDDITAALETKLWTDRRCLQEQQWQLLLQACLSCPSPLYLTAAYSESVLWTSYSPQAGLSLPQSLQGLYLGMLARLERELGQQLVRRAACLISISRWGVTEQELLDLLARDEKVLQEVAPYHSSSSNPRVPYVLWARLKRDLGCHLTEVRTHGTWVYRWTHSELGQVCIKHYLKTAEAHMAVHADYAGYYGDTSQHAHIFQPLAWTLDEEEEDGGRTKSYRFNLRKLHGLPYHLVQAGQILPFLSECLFNYEFLLHKGWGLSILDIEEDLKKAVLPESVLGDVEVLSDALRMSREVLLQDPCQLASQLIGRLGQMIIEDRPVAKGDPLKFSYLHTLLAQCQQSSLPVLLPSSTFLLPPGCLQHFLLSGHLTNVTALGGGRGGPLVVTCESDGTLRFWDVEQRRIIRTLPAVGGVVADSITLGLDDRMVIVRMGQGLQVRDLESGQVVYSESDSVDVPIVTTTCEGQLLVVFYDGSHLVKVFDLASSCFLLHCVNISMECVAIHRDRSILLSNNSIRDYILFAYRSGGDAAVFSARGGTVYSVLSAQHGAASIQAVEMTEDYLLLFCRYPYKNGSEIIHIELFSAVSFLYLRSILGCSQDSISQVTVNRAGTHAVAFCPSPRTGITELVVWNLETEDHKHITRFPAVLTKGLCFDLRLCLGICRGEKYLRLWDLTSRINDQTLTYNIHKLRSEGTEEIIPMGKTLRYAVCLSTRAGTVYVWNLARRRFVCRPVRVERGLYSSTDVVLAHDFRLYILTDRSTDAPSAFQTLLVYDLIKRRYARRQTGITVFPCLQHEYRLLQQGRLLLGLSETRDQLILWDLDSGSINHEIKPPHRESLVRSVSIQDLQPDVTPCREPTLMPWDIRTESQAMKKRRLEREAQQEKEAARRLDREKYNSIEQYLLSEDEQVVVCSYFAHHLNVFSMRSQEHLHTLEDETSLLSLCPAAISYTGSHLVLSNYKQGHNTSHITLWDLHKGTVSETLRNEAGVCCIAIADNADRVVFGVTGSNRLNVWNPIKKRCKSICGYVNLVIDASSKLYMTEGGTKAILLSGQLSLWDLEGCSVLSVLSMDAHVRCTTLLRGHGVRLLLGLTHSPVLISIKSTSGAVGGSANQTSEDGDQFGESSSSEEEEEEEETLT